MGASLGKCIAAEETFIDEMNMNSSPEDKTTGPSTSTSDSSSTSWTSTVETSTEEFISEFGSYFSVSSLTEESESTNTSGTSTTSDTDDATQSDAASLTPPCTIHVPHHSAHHMSIFSASTMVTPVPAEAPKDDKSLFNLPGGLCHGIHDCKAAKRIITALQWHSQSVIQNDDHMQLLQHIKASGYD
eukprot:325052_1